MRMTTNSSGCGRQRRAFLGFQSRKTCFQTWGVRKYRRQSKSDWGWTLGKVGGTFFLWDRLGVRAISRFSVGWVSGKLHHGGKRLIQLRQCANSSKYPRQKIVLTAYLQSSCFNKNVTEIVALQVIGRDGANQTVGSRDDATASRCAV